MVETKRFVNIQVRNAIDRSDGSSQSSEGTIANHTDSTPCRKYLGVHQIGNAPRSSLVGMVRTTFLPSYNKHTFCIRKKQQRNCFYFIAIVAKAAPQRNGKQLDIPPQPTHKEEHNQYQQEYNHSKHGYTIFK